MQARAPSISIAGIVGTGLLALAVAMGIGRFAFTPLLPLMLRDADLDPLSGAEWAMANYIGYLAGALTAARVAVDPRRATLIGLTGVAITTLGIGVLHGEGLVLGGALLRATAGVFSAWVLVGASGWCLVELARAQRAAMSAWIYTGVGFGIALAGIVAWLGGAQPARWLWLELGALAAAGAWAASALSGAAGVAPRVVAPVRPQSRDDAPTSPPPLDATKPASDTGLVVCYGIFGYGYIVLATFLPAMARDQIDDPIVFGLTWPVFGLAAGLSVAIAARWGSALSRERLWSAVQAAMALGTAIPLVSTNLLALIVSAILVGGTFMVATMAGLQLARQRHPANPTPLVARMTIAFAVGQIAGPTIVRGLASAAVLQLDPMHAANLLATVLLSLSALWLWRLERDIVRSATP